MADNITRDDIQRRRRNYKYPKNIFLYSSKKRCHKALDTLQSRLTNLKTCWCWLLSCVFQLGQLGLYLFGDQTSSSDRFDNILSGQVQTSSTTLMKVLWPSDQFNNAPMWHQLQTLWAGPYIFQTLIYCWSDVGNQQRRDLLRVSYVVNNYKSGWNVADFGDDVLKLAAVGRP